MCGASLRGLPGGDRLSDGMRDHRLDETIGRRAAHRQAGSERQFPARVLHMSLVRQNSGRRRRSGASWYRTREWPKGASSQSVVGAL